MANPNQGSGGQPTKRKHAALFDPSKFTSAKKPTTINITNSINPAPTVPGQNTYPPARPPATDPRKRGLSFANLSGQQLADILHNPGPLSKRQKTTMGCQPSRFAHEPSFQLPEIPRPRPSEPVDQFPTTVETEEEEDLEDEQIDYFDHDIGEEDHLYDDDEPIDQFDHTVGAEEEERLDDEPIDQFVHDIGEEDHLYDDEPTDQVDHTAGAEEEKNLDDRPPANLLQHIIGAARGDYPFSHKIDEWLDIAKKEGFLDVRDADAESENHEYDDDHADSYETSDASSVHSGDSGNSKDGVIGYDDVSGYADEVLADDDKDEGASKPPPKKGKKRKRYEKYEFSTDTSTYYSSDDSRGDAKRAKNGGKSKFRHPIIPAPPGEKRNLGRPIPKSFATMSAADKLMFDWWDNRDMGWAAITRKVNEMTGLDEDTMEIATRYAALRRYLHHKERIIIDTSLCEAYEQVDLKLFMAHDEESRGEEYDELRWFLVREAYWKLESISKKPAELKARYEELRRLEAEPEYAGIEEIEDEVFDDGNMDTTDESEREGGEAGEGEKDGEGEGEGYDGDEE